MFDTFVCVERNDTWLESMGYKKVSLFIVVIVLSVLLGLAIVAVIVLVLLQRKKKNFKVMNQPLLED
jgi:flagellar basal body-associated protein FliL